MRFRLTLGYLEAVQCRPYIDGVHEGKEFRDLLHQFDLFVTRVTKSKQQVKDAPAHKDDCRQRSESG
jgi:hypothetical protein